MAFFQFTDPFTIIIGIITLSVLGYTVYKEFVEKAKIKIFVGDTIDLVRDTDGQSRKIHLTCNFANRSAKLGVVHKIVLVLRSSFLKREAGFLWNLFYRYQQGRNAVPESKPYPIPVKGKENVFQGIEFVTEPPVQWKAGQYHFTLMGWVNKRDINSKPNVKSRFSVTLHNDFVIAMSRDEVKEQPKLYTASIDDWAIKLGDEEVLKSIQR